MSGLQASVVVPTYKRPDLLQRCLAALLAQSLPPEAYEIVVVDDAPSDDTRALVDALAQGAGAPALRYCTAPDTQGPAGARNVGWRAARADVVAFTDDDTVPDRDWLRLGVQAMARADLVAVWGRVVVPLPPQPTDHEKNTHGLERAGFVTANVLARRDALERIGGFDERFRRAWREDTDLYFRLQTIGRVEHAADAVVVHPVREAPWGVSLSQQANAAFEALLYKLHPRRYRGEVLPRTPWRYYFIVLATIAALVCLLAGALGGAALLLLTVLVAIADFARLRLRGTSHAPSHVLEMLVTSAAIPYLSVYWRLVGALRWRVLFI